MFAQERLSGHQSVNEEEQISQQSGHPTQLDTEGNQRHQRRQRRAKQQRHECPDTQFDGAQGEEVPRLERVLPRLELL